jgi:proteic killer suppression protein
VDVIYANDDLSYLELDPEFTAGCSQAVVKVFRKRMQQIRAAIDERDFYELRSLRFEKLKGKRKHQHSMRLNDQYRLIVELIKENPDAQSSKIKIVGIEDYH